MVYHDAPFQPVFQGLMATVTAAFLTLAGLGALALLRRFLQSTAVAVVALGLIGVLANNGMFEIQPVYLTGVFSALTWFVVGLALTFWGPVTVFVALYVQQCVRVGAEFMALGSDAMFATGLLMLVVAVLPVIPAILPAPSDPQAADAAA